MTVPEAAANLFELPPEEFTAERDRIAKQLKSSGDAQGATVVKALKRPSVAAYALNLVSRRHPNLIADLMEAGERLGSATSRKAMEEAKADRQTAIAAITARATSLLAEQDRPVTAQVREKLTETLLAAATDEDTRASLQAGQLLKEAVPGGFGVPLATFDPGDGKREERRTSDRAERLRAEADAKLAEARRASAESAKAMRECEELEKAAAAARERAEKLENIARKAEETALAKIAEAAELEERLR